MLTTNTPARQYAPGIGDAVANRTINRKIKDGEETRFETWEEVAERVALGNSLLEPRKHAQEHEREQMRHHLRQASVILSGRHLQHGDATQPNRPIEVFTNCSTSAASFVTFYLLLNGSGVGRAYDDDMMLVDWKQMPIVVPVVDQSHPDVMSGEITALDINAASHMYKTAVETDTFVHFKVPDSREGWAQAIEQIEVLTFQGFKRNYVLALDFSDVRPRGAPIGGMQGRPASGPGPLMNAITKIAKLRDSGMLPWRATMFVDHYLAECVLVGGARRAARMSTKCWRDASIMDFISLKRGGFLWSSNNSVTVDDEFWVGVIDNVGSRKLHAKAVLNELAKCSYFDGTGEPGIINQDKLTVNRDGMSIYSDGVVLNPTRFDVMPQTKQLFASLASRAQRSRHHMITNPCGEITLNMLGGYCVIGDVVPYHAGSNLEEPCNCEGLARRDAAWDKDAEHAFRVTTRMLIRTNLMDSLYEREVKRTNRIGVSMTGVHEYAWARFGFGWKDLVDEEKSLDFWLMLSRFKRAVVHEAAKYSKELGVVVPHTDTTIKPAGTTSKLFGLTEGAHLPSMREYVRWVQFRNDDPLIKDYEAKGYPVRRLRTYEGTTIVGFPTQPEICRLGMGEKLVTAAEATPEEQYEWLRLLEKYWIRGVDKNGEPLPETGNQVSYTLKLDTTKISFQRFYETLIDGQSTVRCCSVLPMGPMDSSAYEYTPEQAVTKDEYERISREIRGETVTEDVGLEHVDCASGACPINFKESLTNS